MQTIITIPYNLKQLNEKKNNEVKVIKLNGKETKFNILNYNNVKCACWYCTLDFNTEKIYLPLKYNNVAFFVFGNFCSLNCVVAYALQNNYNMHKTYSLINLLYDSQVNINPSPNKEVLKKFGGFMNEDEYKEKIKNNIFVDLTHPYDIETNNLIFDETKKLFFILPTEK